MDIFKEPIPHTCPRIDNIQELLKKAIRVLVDNKVSDNYQGVIEDALYYIKDIPDDMEYLREANDSLRKWGQNLILRIGDIEEDLEIRKTGIKSLEEKINDLKYEKSCLEDKIASLEAYLSNN